MARAIVGYERKLVGVERRYEHQVTFFHFKAKNFACSVLADDFVLILPFLRDGSFDPQQYPPPHVVLASPENHPNIHTIDQWDPVFFGKVYGQLLALFPNPYPTSDL